MKVTWRPGVQPKWTPPTVRRKDRSKGALAGANGRSARPLSSSVRTLHYDKQGGPRLTHAQRRRRDKKDRSADARQARLLRSALFGRKGAA